MPITLLDSSSINGLLQIAYEEGLLRDRQDFGDRFLYGLSRNPLAEWHKQQILEQVILNSQLCGINKVPLDWLEGEFLQTNVIQWKEADNVVDEGIQIAPEIIDGILRAKGQNIPIKQYDARFNAMKAVFDKVDEYNKKHPNDEFDSQKIFSRGMFDPKFRNSRVFKLGRKYNKAWSDFKPLADTVDEFIRLSNFAGNNGTNLKTPIYTESSNLINIFSPPKLEGEVVNIFRFVTNQLGSLPFLPTLKSTLELADAPETKALREQIDNWSQSINKGTASVTEMIQKDIKKQIKVWNGVQVSERRDSSRVLLQFQYQ